LSRCTVTVGGAFTATAAETPQSNSPVEEPVPRRGRSTSVRGPNAAASPTSGAMRGAKLIAIRAQLGEGTRARAIVNENGLLRTRCALGYRRSRNLPFNRPNTASPGARTRKRRMTKLPWKRPWVVFALRSTVGNRDPPDCAPAPAGRAASSASEAAAASRTAVRRRFMVASQRILATEVAVGSVAVAVLAEALGQVESQKAADALGKALGDSDPVVRRLAAQALGELDGLKPKRNPKIILPREIFGAQRRNSAGVDLSDPLVREPLLHRLKALEARNWTARPGLGKGEGRPILSPQDHRITVGTTFEATAAEVDRMVRAAHAAQLGWDALGGEARAKLLERAADLYEQHREEFYSLCIREAGKTLIDAVLEVREAVDFLRFYASEARRQFTRPMPLPGPTGEQNELRLHGRGVIASISPWNFPLAIFTGLASAPLAAGNAVIAKPAGQTPLIGALAVELMHRAGIPKDIVQLAPGSGRVVGGALTEHPLLAGVVFTGSTETARTINRTLAERDGPIIPFVAETGGQNAMIVDSSALPEQVTRDVISSAFQSSGQRCSALRVLFVQEDVADAMIRMIAGAMEALKVGDPAELATDVGPVIDQAAKKLLDDHVGWLDKNAKRICRLDSPKEAANGCFVVPAFYEIQSLSQLNRENFGPILHVVRFAGDKLDKVVEDINATGYGLTLGLQSRIDTVRDYVEEHARVGNFYVNRNQIGAVVESQPFGGEGLSGTGPKAGGPHYVARFAIERVTCIDTTAAGGNASLMASIEG